jgi:hypothetical protein
LMRSSAMSPVSNLAQDQALRIIILRGNHPVPASVAKP